MSPARPVPATPAEPAPTPAVPTVGTRTVLIPDERRGSRLPDATLGARVAEIALAGVDVTPVEGRR